MTGRDTLIEYCEYHASQEMKKHIEMCNNVLTYIKGGNMLALASSYCPYYFGIERGEKLCLINNVCSDDKELRTKQCLECWLKIMDSEISGNCIDITDEVCYNVDENKVDGEPNAEI